MITRPSASRILLSLRKELLEIVGPEVTSEHAKVTIQMMENVLRNLAVRADNELGWMREESAAIEAYVADVVEAVPGADAAKAALDAYRTQRTDSWFTADVQADYDRAGEALSCAIEAVLPQGGELKDRAMALLQERLLHDQQIMGEFAFVGRG